jgi:hypothetical protein
MKKKKNNHSVIRGSYIFYMWAFFTIWLVFRLIITVSYIILPYFTTYIGIGYPYNTTYKMKYKAFKTVQFVIL